MLSQRLYEGCYVPQPSMDKSHWKRLGRDMDPHVSTKSGSIEAFLWLSGIW